MSRENQLWAWLKKARLELPDDLDLNRVENGVMKGMPDVEGHLRGQGQFWLELKSAERPARTSTPVRFKFQPGQPEWLVRRWALGGRAFVLCQVGSGGDRRLYLIRGHFAFEAATGLTEQQLAQTGPVLAPRVKPEEVVRRIFI